MSLPQTNSFKIMVFPHKFDCTKDFFYFFFFPVKTVTFSLAAQSPFETLKKKALNV